MQHSFDVDIAKEYGILEAILLNNLWFWIEKNRANNVNFFEDCYWTYNSTRAFNELFPYASQRQIQNALKHLKEKDVIKTGNYNKSAYDRTLWYAFTEKGKCIMQKCKMEDTKKENGDSKNVRPIPDNKPDEKPLNKPDKRKKERTYNEIVNSMIDDTDIKNTIYEFIKMRKLIKKPMTDRAVAMLINKLNKLSNSKEMKIKILEKSILKNWSDIYPYKEEGNNDFNARSTKKHDGSEYAEYD